MEQSVILHFTQRINPSGRVIRFVCAACLLLWRDKHQQHFPFPFSPPAVRFMICKSDHLQ